MSTISRINSKNITSIKQISNYELQNTKVVDGNIYAVRDTHLLYEDVGSNRVRMNVNIITTEIDRQYNTTGFTGNLYYVWETNTLWLFSGGWKVLIGENTEGTNAYYYRNNSLMANDTSRDLTASKGIYSGDGSVIVKDINNIIKGKMFINGLDNVLTISSFLGGGISFLTNGDQPVLGQQSGNLVLRENATAWYYGEFNTTEDIYVNMVSLSENSVSLKLGDINEDGKVDKTDLDLLQSYLDGNYVLSDRQLKIADVNQDGYVNYKDYVELMTLINEGRTGELGNIEYTEQLEEGDAYANRYMVWHEGNFDPTSLILYPEDILRMLQELQPPLDISVKYLQGYEPSAFAWKVHSHVVSDITDFYSKLVTKVNSMVTGGENKGITVNYVAASETFNFLANNFQLSFYGDASGSGLITNLTSTNIQLTVDFTNKEQYIDITKIPGYNDNRDELLALIDDKVPKSDTTKVAAANKLLYLNSAGMLPADITGTAQRAVALTYGRSITLAGGVTGTVIFDASQDVVINTTVIPSLHVHEQYALTSNIGVTICPLGLDLIVPEDYLPGAVKGNMSYQGSWNPSSGAPHSNPQKGWYWTVSSSGTWQNKTYQPGDWIIWNGSSWDSMMSHREAPVQSVNGYVGNVVLTYSDVNAISDTYINYSSPSNIPGNKLVLTDAANHIAITAATADRWVNTITVNLAEESHMYLNTSNSTTTTNGTSNIKWDVRIRDEYIPMLNFVSIGSISTDTDINDILLR